MEFLVLFYDNDYTLEKNGIFSCPDPQNDFLFFLALRSGVCVDVREQMLLLNLWWGGQLSVGDFWEKSLKNFEKFLLKILKQLCLKAYVL